MNHSLDINDLLFKLLSFTPGPFWLALMIAPRHPIVMRLFDGFLFILSALFAFRVIPMVPELLPIIAQPTLESIQSFLMSREGTVGTWNHMILGDLWIGRWVAHDSLRLKHPYWIRIPILFVILFFGPLGLFLYWCIRVLRNRQFLLEYLKN